MPPQLNIPGSQPPQPEPSPAQEEPPPTSGKPQPEIKSLRPANEAPEDRPTQRVFSAYQTGMVPTVTTPTPTIAQTTAAVQLAVAHQAVEIEKTTHKAPSWIYSVIGSCGAIIGMILLIKMGVLDGPLGITNSDAVEVERERIVDILESDGIDVEFYDHFKP